VPVLDQTLGGFDVGVLVQQNDAEPLLDAVIQE
jgi:hypothetical protein